MQNAHPKQSVSTLGILTKTLPSAYVVFYRTKHNRYSINALVGALESHIERLGIEIHITQTKEDTIWLLNHLSTTGAPILLCVSFSTPAYWEVKELLAHPQLSHKRGITTIAGGPHPTGDPISTFELGFDFVALGEGESSIIQFLEAWLSKRDPTAIPTILPNDNTSIKRLSSLTRYHSRVELDRYPSFSDRFRLFGPIEITRGCPFRCAFCQTGQIHGARPRHRSVESILVHVETLLCYGIKDIRFITPNAFAYGSDSGITIEPAKLELLLSSVRKLIGSRGRIFFGTFPSEVRPEHVNEQTIALVKKFTDNTNLIIGAQTGSPRLLEACHRRHTLDDVRNAVRLIASAGLTPNVDFIFGLPGETEEDLQLTLKFISELINMGARVHAHSFIPLPGTPMGRSAPEPLPKELIRTLCTLTAQKSLYGQWRQQQVMAQRIWHEILARNFNNTTHSCGTA